MSEVFIAAVEGNLRTEMIKLEENNVISEEADIGTNILVESAELLKVLEGTSGHTVVLIQPDGRTLSQVKAEEG